MTKKTDKVKLICIVPAAGISSRYKNGNKLFDKNFGNNNLQVITSSLMSLSLDEIDKIIIGYNENDKLAREYLDNFSQIAKEKISLNEDKIKFLKGGKSRQETVYNAMKFVGENIDDCSDLWVLVHDAARPCLKSNEIKLFINETIKSNVSSIMAYPIFDTIKKVDKNFKISSTISRDEIWVAQTPQMFKYSILFESLEHCKNNNIEISDESQALETLGYECMVNMGYSHNIKITQNKDMDLGKYIIKSGDGND
jgi:2-C-methyl-D-erythritol 4-phosphate cytidylyltransferase